MNKNIIMAILLLSVTLVALSTVSSADASVNTTIHNSSISTSNSSVNSVSNVVLNVSKTNKNINTKSNVSQVKNTTNNLNKVNKLKTTNNKSIKSDMLPITMNTSDVVCEYGSETVIPVVLNPEPEDGVIMFYLADLIEDVCPYTDHRDLIYNGVNYEPGVYLLETRYMQSSVYNEATSLNHTMTIYDSSRLKTNATRLTFNKDSNKGSSVSLTAEADSQSAAVSPLYIEEGSIKFYINNKLVATQTPTDEGVSNFTITKDMVNSLNAGTYTWKAVYSNINTYLRTSTVTGNLTVYESKNVKINTSKSYKANVGDVVEIPVTFNETAVKDGILTLSYGKSIDAKANISKGETLKFNTTGYLAGQYTLVINYLNSSTYKNATTSTILNLYEPTNITADTKTITFNTGKGNTKNIKFTVNTGTSGYPLDGSIDIYMNNTIINTIKVSESNTVTFTLNDDNIKELLPGTYTLLAKYSVGNTYHPDSNATITVKITSDVKLEMANPINVLADSTVTIPVNVTSNNITVTTGILTYKIDGNTIGKVDLSTSKARYSINTAGLSPGTHKLTVDYTSAIYNSNSNTTILNVLQREDTINAELLNNTAGNTTIKVTMTDTETGNAVPNGTVTIIDNNGNTVGTGTIKNGTVTIKTNINTKGTYTLKVNYDGTNTNYKDNTYTLDNIKLVGKSSKITATVTNNTIGNTTIKVQLKDEIAGTPLVNKNITVTLPDTTTINTTTDASGMANIKLNLSSSGAVVVRYAGDSEYSTSGTILKIDLVKRQDKLLATLTNNTAGNATIKVTVKDATTGEAVPNGYITITDSTGNTIGFGVVNNGESLISTNIQNVGTYNLKINYDGTNTNYTDNTYNLNNIKIIQRETTINPTVINNTVGNTTIKVTVNDKITGNLVPNGTVIIKDADENVIAKEAVVNGTATITMNLDKKTQDLRVSYDGTNTNYKNSTYDLNNFEVVGRNATITTTITNRTVGNTTIEIEARDTTTNETIKNMDIIVKLPDGTITVVKTNETGTAVAHLNLPVGDNNVTVITVSNDQYNSTNTSIPIVIKQRESTIKAGITNHLARNLTINVYVTDSTTEKSVPNGTVTIEDENGTVVGEGIVNDGIVTITTNINKAGTLDLTVNYDGTNTDYKNSTCNLDNVVVSRRNSILSARVVNSTVGNTTILLELKDYITNEVISNALLRVTLPDGTLFTTRTNASGILINPNLPVGRNYIKVEYAGSQVYNEASTVVEANIIQRQSTTTALVTDNIAGQVTVDVNVIDTTTGKAVPNGTVTISDATGKTIGTGNIIVGQTTITIDSNKGIQDLIVSYDGASTDYKDNTYTIRNVEVVGRNATITTKVINDTIGNTTIQIKTIDTVTRKIITNAPLTITLPDTTKTTATTDENGIANVKLNIPAGNNNITIDFTGNSKYNATTKNSTVNVIKLASNVSVTEFKAKSGETVILHAIVTNMTGDIINGGNLVFKINGKTICDSEGNAIKVSVVNGIATLTYTIPIDFHSLTYKLSAVYSGNDEYDGSYSASKLINIEKRQATVTVSTLSSAKINDEINITVKIADKTNSSLKINGYIILKFNGKTLKDEESGNAIQIKLNNEQVNYIYKIPKMLRSSVKITAVLVNNNTYTRSEGDTNVIIANSLKTLASESKEVKTLTSSPSTSFLKGNSAKQFVNLKVDNTVMKINTTNQISVSVTSQYKNKINTGKIIFTYNNKTIQTSNVKSGQSIFKYSFTKTGLYNITAKYTDNTGKYYNAIQKFTVKVVDFRSQIKIKITKTKIDTTDDLTVTYTDTFKNKVNQGTATIYIDNKKISTTNVVNGETIIDTTKLKIGSHTINITYNENEVYKKTKITSKITIKPITTKVTVNNFTLVAGKNTTITVNVKTKDNVPVTNGYITYKINKHTQLNTKNKTIQIPVTNGIATIKYAVPLSMMNKTVELLIKYTGTSTLNASQRTITKKVIKNKNLTLNVNNIKAKIGANITLKATITDKKANTVNAGKVTFKLNGITIKDAKGKTLMANVKNGVATIKYQIPAYTAKTYKLTCVYGYLTQRLEVNKTLTIQKLNTKIIRKTTTKTTKTNKTRIQATILDERGNKITTDTKITVKVNKKVVINKYKVKQGKINITIPTQKIGSYNITLMAGENSKYNAANTTFKMTRLKA